MCKEKITEQQKQLFILKLNKNNNNNKKKNNTCLLNFYSLSNILHTGGTKLIDYLCALIDLFTDMAAILNLLDLRSIIYGMPRGALARYLRMLFRQKENFNLYFLGKRRSLLHPKIFFSDYNLFLGKLLKNWPEKHA